MADPAQHDNEPKVTRLDDSTRQRGEGDAQAPTTTQAAEPAGTPPTPAAPSSGRSFRAPRIAFGRPLLRLVLMVVLPLVAAIYGAICWGESMRYISTENAYVKANVVAISADVSGRVIEIDAVENERSNAGQVLFRLDPRTFEIAIASANAEMGAARGAIESIRAEYFGGVQQVDELRETVRFQEGEQERQLKLVQRGVGTKQKLDQARYDVELAKRELKTMQKRNNMWLAELGGNARIKAENHPKYLKAQAALDQAQYDFDRTNVLAPVDGLVGNIKLQIGEYVRAGQPVFSVIQTDAPWIEANLKETQLTDVEIGQKANITVDAYPDRQFAATVESLAPATGAEFSLLPAQNASGNWVKVVQRIPVRLKIERSPDLPTLRAGMTVTVDIDTMRDRSLGVMIGELLEWLGLDGVVPESAYAEAGK